MGYIYLIREREFVNSKKNIYKIGRTDAYDVRSRLKSYPSDSEVIFFIQVEHSKEVEKRLLKNFDDTFENKLKLGREYYEGNKDQMISLILQDKHMIHLKTEDILSINRWKFFRSIKYYFPRW